MLSTLSHTHGSCPDTRHLAEGAIHSMRGWSHHLAPPLVQSLALRLRGTIQGDRTAGVLLQAAHAGPRLSCGERQPQRKSPFGASLSGEKAGRRNSGHGGAVAHLACKPSRAKPKRALLDSTVSETASTSSHASCDCTSIVEQALMVGKKRMPHTTNLHASGRIRVID
jgi:hypothetical protein